jgi:hypothetical protein
LLVTVLAWVEFKGRSMEFLKSALVGLIGPVTYLGTSFAICLLKAPSTIIGNVEKERDELKAKYGDAPKAEIVIDPKLDVHLKLGLFLHGIVKNKQKMIENGRVLLCDVTSNVNAKVEEMYLQWVASDKDVDHIRPWANKKFDILLINRGQAEFIGYIGEVYEYSQPLPWGIYHFTLQLEGDNVTEKIEKKFRIELIPNKDPKVTEA